MGRKNDLIKMSTDETRKKRQRKRKHTDTAKPG